MMIMIAIEKYDKHVKMFFNEGLHFSLFVMLERFREHRFRNIVQRQPSSETTFKESANCPNI